MGSDAIRYFKDVLNEISSKQKIDLFLYSRGGEINAPLPLVNLIRNHCEEFSVLVPYRAHSAATLICLGADKIIMNEMGQLSPIDPTTGNVFNPIDPSNPTGRWPISVEDVSNYLSLASEKAKLVTEESLKDVFHLLSEKVHPIALGNVHRIYNLIRLLAPKLLSLHMDCSSVTEKAKIKAIVDTLTEKLYTHEYLISREEAKEIGLKIIYPEPILDKLMWNLYKQYERELKLLDPFNPIQIVQAPLQPKASQQQSVNQGTPLPICKHQEQCAFLESRNMSYALTTDIEIYPPPTLQQIVSMINPQIVSQIITQLVQVVQQLNLVPPTVKFTSQQWLSI